MAPRKLFFGKKRDPLDAEFDERIALGQVVGERLAPNALLESDRILLKHGMYNLAGPATAGCPDGIAAIHDLEIFGKRLPMVYKSEVVWYWTEHVRGSMADHILWCPLLLEPPLVAPYASQVSCGRRPFRNCRLGRGDVFVPLPNRVYSGYSYY